MTSTCFLFFIDSLKVASVKCTIFSPEVSLHGRSGGGGGGGSLGLNKEKIRQVLFVVGSMEAPSKAFLLFSCSLIG